jgi:hypothetical protein
MDKFEALEVGALDAWDRSDFRTALEQWDRILDGDSGYPKEERNRIENNRLCAIEKLNHRFSEYPYEIVQHLTKIKQRRNSSDPKIGITLFILSCKRYELFTRTVNSFLNACMDLDLIDEWICVDDNSHENERAAMQAIYPFFEFVMKGPEDAGHARSLNMLRKRITSPFVLALEDDWLFVKKENYVGRCLSILMREDPSVKQVLLNRYYVETIDEGYLSVEGGIQKKDSGGHKYILHEYYSPSSKEYEKYSEQYPNNFSHQPHFALRPSMYKREIFDVVGGFVEDEDVEFETEYAHRYTAAGFRSAYLTSINCIHIGRLNRERFDKNAEPNAYQLNSKKQYGTFWPNDSKSKKKNDDEKLALTVTTCKRLEKFIHSMSTTLSMCKDLYLVDRFLIVDDNSSELDRKIMKERFPFFEFVFKTPAQKGHAKSMNMIVDACKDYDYIFHTEDDWDYRSQYSLGDAIVLLRENHTDQVILRWHEYCTARREKYKGIQYRAHYHDLSDPNIPEFFDSWRTLQLTKADWKDNKKISGGCWWPTLSLNPAIWNMNSFRESEERFDEDMNPTFFEYAISFRLYKKGWRVCMFETEMSQYPQLTAYYLNDHLRDYDANGCEPHRAMGGDPNCPYCVAQKQCFDHSVEGITRVVEIE